MLNVNCSLFVILDPFDSAKVHNLFDLFKYNYHANNVIQRYATLFNVIPNILRYFLCNITLFYYLCRAIETKHQTNKL